MPPTTPLVFKNITPALYANLVQKVKRSGLSVNGNSGTTSRFGIEIDWDYSPTLQQLTVQCLRAPFFMSSETVKAKIRSLVFDTFRETVS